MTPAKAEQERATEVVRRYLGDSATDAPTIYTLTNYGRGSTDYVRVFVVSDERIVEITYYVAKAYALRHTDQGIAFRGGQYSKGLEAADAAWRTAFGTALDQSYWQEL